MEKTIIKSRAETKTGRILLAVSIILALSLIPIFFRIRNDCYYMGWSIVGLLTYETYRWVLMFKSFWFYFGIVVLLTDIFFWILLIAISNSELTVSDVRVSGKSRFGKVVDLPIDMVISVSRSKRFSSVGVSTASGTTKFYLLENYEEIYQVLNDLVFKRQQQTRMESVSRTSSAEELQQYKALLDSGVISQEEFDIKKHQLLGF